MKSKFKLILAAVAGLIVFVALVWIFRPVSENEKIERVLHEIAAACQAKNTSNVKEVLSEDFIVKPHDNREDVLIWLRRFFFQVRELEVALAHIGHENPDLPKDSQKARVIVVAKISGTIDGQKFQGFGSNGIDTVLVSLKKIEGLWKISAAEYVKLDSQDPAAALKYFQK
jgi:hypothetical protein